MISKKSHKPSQTSVPSSLAKFAGITAEVEDHVSLGIGGFGIGAQAYLYESDKDRAIKIARLYINHLSPKHKIALKEYLINLFELWKIEEGIPNKPPKSLKSEKLGLSGLILNYARDDYESEERFSLLEHMTPWEAAPFYVSSPIGLYHHICSTNFRQIPDGDYGNLLAITLIYCGELNEKSFWPEMIKQALWFAEREIDTLNSFSKDLFSKHNRLKRQNSSRTKGLFQANESLKHQAENVRIKIYHFADRYLEQGKSPRLIVSLIEKFGDLKIGNRQIRNHLQEHPSGHWAPKSHK